MSSASFYIRVASLEMVALFLAIAGCDRGSKPELVGQMAPDFTVSDSQHTVSLHDYKGKVVVLNFWATWCAPCLDELPSLIQMQRDLGDRVTVLAVATDQDPDMYARFMRDHQVDFISVNDSAQQSNAKYGTWGWPETYIIDANGIVRRKFIGPVEWTSPVIVSYLEALQAKS